MAHGKHGSGGRPKLQGKAKPIYNRAQSAGGSPFKNEADKRGALVAPPGWTGTQSEWLVYSVLTKGLHMTDGFGADFTYQARLSTTGGLPGRIELGGLIADFLLPMRRLVVQVVSDFYHYRDMSDVTKERGNAAALAGQGYYTIWIDSGDLDKDASYFVKEALDLHDHSKLASGMV